MVYVLCGLFTGLAAIAYAAVTPTAVSYTHLIEREQGFREGLGYYNKNVVDVVYCNSQFDKASQLTDCLLYKSCN